MSSIKPAMGTCNGKGRYYPHCGRTNVRMGNKSKGLCVWCNEKHKSQGKGKRFIQPVSEKQSQFISQANEYYTKAIKLNKERNKGVCRCENCGAEIKSPSGRNVSHIVGKGADLRLYLNMSNHNILCDLCEDVWTNGDKTKMPIYRASMRVRSILLESLVPEHLKKTTPQ